MEEKKYLKISSGTAICIFIIFLLIIALICLGFYTYTIKNNNTEKISATEQNNSELDETIETNTSDLLDTNITDSGAEIDLQDAIVAKLTEKIDFYDHAIASIYKVGTFDLETIPNDLILRLGWAKINENDKKLIEKDNGFIQTATKKIMNESIVNIFGSKVKYSDESFTNIDVPTFLGYNANRGKINYSDNVYTADYVEGGGGDVPFIHQEVKKVLKYNDKIELYVNTAFIDTEYIDNTNGDFKYIIYKNFNNDKFEEKVSETISEEFDSEISKITDKLNTYVYTFELDDTTGEYYLSQFNISK